MRRGSSPLPSSNSDWMEEVPIVPSKKEHSLYWDRKASTHTTIKKRTGPNKGGRGKVARLNGE